MERYKVIKKIKAYHEYPEDGDITLRYNTTVYRDDTLTFNEYTMEFIIEGGNGKVIIINKSDMTTSLVKLGQEGNDIIHISSKLCMVKDLGLNDYLFGGNMLGWMDEVAYIYARKATGKDSLVTLRFGEIKFIRPVKEHDIVDFYVFGDKLGESSITFNLEGRIGVNVVFSTDCTFVAIDENGKKTNII